MRLRTDAVRPFAYVATEFAHLTHRNEEIAMKRHWIEEGWRRFLDRLRELWGKGTARPGNGPSAMST